MKNIPLEISQLSQYGGSAAVIGFVLIIVIVIIVLVVVIVIINNSSDSTTSDSTPPDSTPSDSTPPDSTNVTFTTPTTISTTDDGSTYTFCATGLNEIGDGKIDRCLQVLGGSTDGNPLTYHGTKSVDATVNNGRYYYTEVTSNGTPFKTLSTETFGGSFITGFPFLQAVGGSKSGNPIEIRSSLISEITTNGSFDIQKVGTDANGKDFYTICTKDLDDGSKTLCFGTSSLANDPAPVSLMDDQATSSKKNTATYYMEKV